MPTLEDEARRGFRSYDVFDTVLTRMVGLPSSVFRLVGERIIDKGIWYGTSEQFMEARLLAETLAKAHSPSGEIDLAGIYRQIAFVYGLTDVECATIAGEELSTEEAVLRAVPATLSRLDFDRRQGMCVGFISDMYLPSLVIRRWLAEVGACRDGDLIWVSCEQGRTKSRGDLFDLVAEQFPARRSSWHHFGDNIRADVQSPRSKGISAEHFSSCHLSAAEQSMEASARHTCGLSSLMAGASRWTRVSLQGGADSSKVTLNSYAAEVVGPMLYGFALWAIQETEKKQARRLWFMDSCGDVLVSISTAIAKRLGAQLEIGRLYLDRKSLRIASLRDINEAALAWILDGAANVTLGGVLERVGLRLDDSLALRAAEFGLAASGLLGEIGAGDLRGYLLDPELKARILLAASEHRAALIDYLRQCELFGTEACCLVDLGWSNSRMNDILDLMGSECFERHRWLIFGLRRSSTGTMGVSVRGYLFEVEGTEYCGMGAKFECLSSLVETVCQAEEGSLTALVRRNGRLEPVHQVRSVDAHAMSTVRFLQGRLVVFAQSVLVELIGHKPVDLRPLTVELLERGLYRPTTSEARLLGKIWISTAEGLTTALRPRPYRWQDARSAFRSGGWPRLEPNWWLAGAVALTPRSIQILLKIAARLGRLVRSGRFGRLRFA